ncbi:uncharacterized protein MONOS_7125 [Monocercomonoides exilis]|uniref:uncharacterized protein n=1 Tax=Monocercomonoides exilis TaxID=2049356 RepID=UPI0035593A7A|nr:hypothetical protein MONOS_7125 [Monocercomonoides exilis]|eukprot:MONOS_7125.1-p1 / transcript=MONOS_7125.1 / gene=MONOS_7125 / organism=Monocercomonoides_exilis_PA203 / gene_product=unspecified product / transcript_product=unspecified product / location=Mono_scaffold00237:23015-24462(-) / protein_length=442 / sequence_SO=supercontig / SO=protein_coding / is_pseudo=false
MRNECMSDNFVQNLSLRDKFSKMFSELEHCPESEQKQKIGEMNEIIDEMNVEEFKSVFTTRMFNKMDKLIEEKKLQLGNAILLLKHAGFCKALKRIWIEEFEYSTLNERFKKMIAEEEGKKDEKNEKLLTEICECYLYLNDRTISRLPYACVTCLLKAALKKEESKEVQEEAEMALLALCSIGENFVEQKLYLSDIKEIIKYHQEHRNLTRLGYQSAWQFLNDQLFIDDCLNGEIVNELHFAREVGKELEEFAKCVDWKKEKEEEMGKEMKEELVLMRWLQTLEFYFGCCRLKNEEFAGLIGGIAWVYRAAKGNNGVIRNQCVVAFEKAAENRTVNVEGLLKGGAVDAVFEEMQQPTLNIDRVCGFLQFFENVSNRLEEKMDDEMEEEQRKETKRKIFEKIEEEGYEDTVTSYHGLFHFLKVKIFYSGALSVDISDYCENV